MQRSSVKKAVSKGLPSKKQSPRIDKNWKRLHWNTNSTKYTHCGRQLYHDYAAKTDSTL